MRRLAAVALLVLAGCASSSSSGFVDAMVDCAEAGNEVSVMLYPGDVEDVMMQSAVQRDLPLTLQVEVSNNSDHDITVKSISVRSTGVRSRFQMNPAFANFNEAIDEGKEHVFTLRAYGRWRMLTDGEDRPTDSIEVETRVVLTNGETYRCRFEMPVH